ncbi:OprO/OprP family phosphate-selective porin [Alcanivorax sp. JB21]|uniref:OprO/OprP family phosphate-selective porin n=1 Tax=Alcanivorax limicola TaxID=2874102 RepID=UPI001CC05014|nr:OprO/OprP family phosphate-selective porin [Alcanivorax limicola]MBZ2189575.1 OprO/OprP family phosphate-selective porin [Alcanivorax limicola]
MLTPPVNAQPAPLISGGVWFNHVFDDNNALDRRTGGETGDVALILYASDNDQYDDWRFGVEFRLGDGSFTQPDNNHTGNNFGFKYAWAGKDLNDSARVRLGKLDVPFGVPRLNFWPGEMLRGGYGDTQDVGIRLDDRVGNISYAIGYFHADDFGGTSTDTMDDNGHWGQSVCDDTVPGDCALAYRKVQTLAGSVDWHLSEHHTLGLSAQRGRLQDLAPLVDESGSIGGESRINGDHYAAEVNYRYTRGAWQMAAQYFTVERELPRVAETVRNDRQVLTLGYEQNRWFFFVEGTSAKSRTRGASTGSVYGVSPGARYHYGPGWIYLEYLRQNGDIDRAGDIVEGDFDAVYLTLDFYF